VNTFGQHEIDSLDFVDQAINILYVLLSDYVLDGHIDLEECNSFKSWAIEADSSDVSELSSEEEDAGDIEKNNLLNPHSILNHIENEKCFELMRSNRSEILRLLQRLLVVGDAEVAEQGAKCF